MRIFQMACACERGAWGAVMQTASALRLTRPGVAVIYYDSLNFAHQIASQGK